MASIASCELLSVIDCYFFFFSQQPEDVGGSKVVSQLAAEGAAVAEIKDSEQQQQHLAELETELGEYRQHTYSEVKVLNRDLNLNFKGIVQYRIVFLYAYISCGFEYSIFYEIRVLLLALINFWSCRLIQICFTKVMLLIFG